MDKTIQEQEFEAKVLEAWTDLMSIFQFSDPPPCNELYKRNPNPSMKEVYGEIGELMKDAAIAREVFLRTGKCNCADCRECNND